MDDTERPLNERGKQDAPVMAKRLKDKKIEIDIFISSPAKRAHKTCKYFAKEYGLDKKDIVLINKLYGASVTGFLEVISKLEDKYKSVIIFSHNPGITEVANILTSVHVDNMPTCSVFSVQANISHWAEFSKSEKSFLFFDYPKNPLE